jgi:hypothetical protein
MPFRHGHKKENFARNGRRYDLILDTKTTRSPFAYTPSLSPGATYATVGGDVSRLLQFPIFGWWIRQTTGKTVRLIMLKQNQDLPYLNERFEAGQLITGGPVGPEGGVLAFVLLGLTTFAFHRVYPSAPMARPAPAVSVGFLPPVVGNAE